MKLFKGHAVMPRVGYEGVHMVRSYLLTAADWREAQLRIAEREPNAALVTVPGEMPDPLMIEVRSIDQRECEDLRAACAWNESRLRESRA